MVEATGPRATNPAAIAALVVGVVAVFTGVLFVTAPLGALLAVLAMVLGAIGVTKARRTNASGIGMSIGGMVTGLIGLVAASVWLALGISLVSAAKETVGLEQQIESEAARLGPTRSVFDLSVGDCYNHVVGDADQRVTLVPCNQPHRHEVFALLRVDLGSDVLYPGVNELRRTAGSYCKTEPFHSFVGSNYYSGSPLMVDTIFPNPTTWANGDREIVCVISDPAGPVVGTLRDSERQPRAPARRVFPSPLPVVPVEPSPLPSP